MSSLDVLLSNPALPYPNKPAVRVKASSLASTVRSLIPKLGSFYGPDGTEHTLILFAGTIPITYMGSQYNIPVEIFLTAGFPATAPHAFVRPTSTMIVKPGHSCVSPDGLVSLAYLQNWRADIPHQSSLVELVNVMSTNFSREPPLFTVTNSPPPPKPAMPTRSPAVVATAASSSSYQSYPPSQASVIDAREASRMATATAAINTPTTAQATVVAPHTQPQPRTSFLPELQRTSQHQPQQQQFTPASSGTSAAAYASEAERKKKALLAQVTEKLQIELSCRHSAAEAEMEAETEAEHDIDAIITRSAEELEDAWSQLKLLSQQIDDASSHMEDSRKEFRGWLGDIELRLKGDEDVEQRLQPFDALSAQIVKLTAENMAIEDTMFHIERALESAQNKSVDATSVVKALRRLAKQQFLCKAHLLKIRETIKNEL